MGKHLPPPPLPFPPKITPFHVGNPTFHITLGRINGYDESKEAQWQWMAGINTLEPLTEEKHFASLKV
ncbi:hypothetical protein Tco_0652018 [Tanacetum coccineum]|uniref:Uncharacterized protein n=1 Tax=Tanacetum coccineum TaxID=301880 RepID=A0ABQ4WWE3_9ASTR